MIKEICFKEEWLDSFRNRKAHKRIDKIILEKMIYALHMLEQLKVNGLEFTFKGGTSLLLLIEEGNRFSIDIDIICKTERSELERVLANVIETSNFKSYELDEHRSYKSGIPKAHYIFSYDTALKTSYPGRILLDVLIEDSIYPETIEKAIKTKWIETDSEVKVTVPSIDAITGDKLTAFAPNTIGIPYIKSGQSFTMEICKQLFDLGKLFDQIQNFETVTRSFMIFAEQEIEYRKNESPNLTPVQVLYDTIDTCLIFAKQGKGDVIEQYKFAQLQKGIIAFGTGFLMSGNFRIDEAIVATAKVSYLAAKILKKDLSRIQYFEGQDISPLNIESPDWNFLNRLKRQPDKSSFYYWYHTVQLLTNSTE
ncbi:MAG: nucleotidyl transferase AbiEii/AbiGii toxin family protein [Mariniphaga sp.]